MLTMIRQDLHAVFDRDPAARNTLEVFLTCAGFQALLAHRLAHRLWKMRIRFFARLLAQAARWVTGVEIHPGASIGHGFFIDHGMGVVIGETAEVGDCVTLFQGVTLGGTGKEKGKRHPTLGKHVVVGSGAKVLGNIRIGDFVKIGANSVVLRSVPSNATVIGIPGRVIKSVGVRVPEEAMDHANVPDPIMERLEAMERDMIDLRKKLENAEGDSRQ